MKIFLFVLIIAAASVGLSMYGTKKSALQEQQIIAIKTEKIVMPTSNSPSTVNQGYSDASLGTDFN